LIKRFAFIALLALGLPAFGAWPVRPGTVKVVVKKTARVNAAVPREVVDQHGAAVVFEGSASAVIEVPQARAEQLRNALAKNADSVEIRDELDTIDFLSFPVDARKGAPVYPQGWVKAKSSARDAFVVQFAAAPQKEWLDTLQSNGLKIVSYVPQNAYVVIGSAANVARVREMLPVQFAELHQPVHKITPELRAEHNELVDVTVVLAKIAEATSAREMLRTAMLSELQPMTDAGDRELYRVRMHANALAKLAAETGVLWIEPAPDMQLSGEREVYLTSGDTLTTKPSSTQLRPAAPTNYRSWLSGKGISNYTTAAKVAILDTGFDDGTATNPHFDFRNSASGSFVELVDYTVRQLTPMSDCYGHGTAVAGVIAGNAGSSFSTSTRDIGSSFGDYDYLMGLGIAPAIPLVSGRIFNYNLGSGATHFEPQAFTTIYPDLVSRQVKITSNSWNDAQQVNAGRYTADTQTMDRLVRKTNINDTGAPMAIYFSVGNLESAAAGELRAQPPSTGKNIVSMGGSESYNPISSYPVRDALNAGVNSDNGFDPYVDSARGTTDNRYKPDLVAPATAMEAPRTTSQTPCFSTNATASIGPVLDPGNPVNQQHIWSRGTSFSSPGGAANAALLYTWWKNKTTLSPSPALLKAMQVNFAQSMPTLAAAPETRQGYGKVDLTNAFKTDGRYAWADQTTVLTPSNSMVWLPALTGTYTIKDTTKPVRVTLVWTDRAAEPLATNALVNDLNLIVQGTSGTVAIGNDINPTTGRSRTYYNQTLTYDHRNNVEQVVLNSTDLGRSITIQIWGEAITADAINPWTGTTPQQDFALFIENVIGQ
jgi:hypothetical protein